jgi:hypothetical protein
MTSPESLGGGDVTSGSDAQPPIACTLTPGELHCQAAELLPGLAARASGGDWTEVGMHLRFASTAGNLAAITSTIDRERSCCAFLTFRLEVPAAGGDFLLGVSGPAGTREFLDALAIRLPERSADAREQSAEGVSTRHALPGSRDR